MSRHGSQQPPKPDGFIQSSTQCAPYTKKICHLKSQGAINPANQQWYCWLVVWALITIFTSWGARTSPSPSLFDAVLLPETEQHHQGLGKLRHENTLDKWTHSLKHDQRCNNASAYARSIPSWLSRRWARQSNKYPNPNTDNFWKRLREREENMSIPVLLPPTASPIIHLKHM